MGVSETGQYLDLPPDSGQVSIVHNLRLLDILDGHLDGQTDRENRLIRVRYFCGLLFCLFFLSTKTCPWCEPGLELNVTGFCFIL